MFELKKQMDAIDPSLATKVWRRLRKPLKYGTYESGFIDKESDYTYEVYAKISGTLYLVRVHKVGKHWVTTGAISGTDLDKLDFDGDLSF